MGRRNFKTQCIYKFVCSISHYRLDSIVVSRFVLLIGRTAFSACAELAFRRLQGVNTQTRLLLHSTNFFQSNLLSYLFSPLVHFGYRQHPGIPQFADIILQCLIERGPQALHLSKSLNPETPSHRIQEQWLTKVQ